MSGNVSAHLYPTMPVYYELTTWRWWREYWPIRRPHSFIQPVAHSRAQLCLIMLKNSGETYGGGERRSLTPAKKRPIEPNDLIACGKSFQVFDATAVKEWAPAFVRNVGIFKFCVLCDEPYCNSKKIYDGCWVWSVLTTNFNCWRVADAFKLSNFVNPWHSLDVVNHVYTASTHCTRLQVFLTTHYQRGHTLY